MRGIIKRFTENGQDVLVECGASTTAVNSGGYAVFDAKDDMDLEEREEYDSHLAGYMIGTVTKPPIMIGDTVQIVDVEGTLTIGKPFFDKGDERILTALRAK